MRIFGNTARHGTRPLPLGAVAGLLLSVPLSLSLSGQDRDPFEAAKARIGANMERSNAQFEVARALANDRFESARAQIDAAIETAKRRLEARWGDAVRLPEKASWVGYFDNDGARIIVDYEKGVATVEGVDGQNETALRNILDRASRMDGSDLDQADPVLRELQTGRAPLAHRGGDRADLRSLLNLKAAKPKRQRSNARTESLALTVPFESDWLNRKTQEVLPLARRQAERYDLPVSLVLAVIHTESSFNPRAMSPIPAYGLMQLVPTSGGADAWAALGREQTPLNPDDLFDPEMNVELGATYLDILNNRYLRGITNPENRLYAVISAYNTGAGNVMRVFGSRRVSKEALAQINAMTPDALYKKLVRDLPYEETRNYLKKVRDRRASFSRFDVGSSSL